MRVQSKGHPIEPEDVMAYLDGELPAERALQVAEHLGVCRECQAFALDLRRVSERMTEWQVDVADLGPPRVDAVGGKALEARRPWYSWKPVWVAAAAVFVMAAGVAVVKFSTRDRRIPQFDRLEQFAALRSAPRTVPAVPQHMARLPNARLEDPLLETAGAEPLIARSAHLSLVAKDFSRVNDALDQVLKRHHGFAAEMNVNTEAASARTLDASLRTPEAELDATISGLRALGRVTNESRKGEDVTRQSIDLDARLANARNEEKVLTDLLNRRTARLSDALEVEREISSTRGQIEQMEAERRNLDKRVEYARIDLHITEVYQAQLDGNRTGALMRLRNAAVDGTRNVSESLVNVAAFALSDGPVMLIWCAVVGIPGWWAVRRLRSMNARRIR